MRRTLRGAHPDDEVCAVSASPALIPYDRAPGPTGRRIGGSSVDADLIGRAQRGDEEAFASLAVAAGDRLHRVAHRILRDIEPAPRTRRSRRCSPSGGTFRSSATRRASTPGRTGSSCAPATPRARRTRRWSPNIRLLPADEPDGGGWHELGRRSRPARARLPAAVHRPSRGGGAAPLPRPAARRGRRDARRPRRDGPFPSASCDARVARGPRGRRAPDHTGGRE